MNNHAIGENIRKIRCMNGLKQRHLAISLGVAISTISNWERGASRFTDKRIGHIASALGVSPALLKDGFELVTASYFPAQKERR